MKTTKFLICGLLLSSLFFFSCEKEGDKKEVKEAPLFPLSIGNSWTYQNLTYNWHYPYAEPYEDEPFNIKIDYSYTIDGKTGYTAAEYTEGQPVSLLNNDNKGNTIEYFFNNNKLVHQTFFIKKNLKKGDKWVRQTAVYSNGDFSQYEIQEWEIACIATDTLIITPAGEFQCVGLLYHPEAFESNGDFSHTFVSYYAENVGQVKYLHYEYKNTDKNLFRERVLIDYSVKKE